MAEINHRVGIKGSPDAIYHALTTNEGLSAWWTTDTQGAGDVGSIINFRFGGGGPDFEVVALEPGIMVQWKHRGAVPEDWMGTEITFVLRKEENETIVRFQHADWQEATDFLAHCSTKWAVFLLSLKEFIETGKGRPFPGDVPIDHSE